MKVFLPLFIALFCFTPFQAQTNDSIDAIIDSVKVDTLKLKKINDLSVHYRNVNPALHLYCIEKGLEYSKKYNNNKNKTIFLREKGIYYRKQSELDSALHYYNLATTSFKSKDSSLYYAIISSKANVKTAQGDYEASTDLMSSILKYYQNSKNKKNKINVLKTKVNLASLYIQKKEYERAKNMLFQVIEENNNENPSFNRVSYINMVVCYIKLKKLDSALAYSKKAEKFKLSKRSKANLTNNMGIIYQDLKKFDSAVVYYKKSLNLYESLSSTNGIIKSYNNLGNVSRLQGKYTQAENYLLKAQNLLNEADAAFSRDSNYEILRDLYRDKKDYKKAFEIQSKLAAFRDSLLGIEKQKAISELEVKYETQRINSEKEVAEANALLAQNENKRKQNYIIGLGVIAALILIASIFFFGRLKAKKEAELVTVELHETQKRLALEKQYRDSELKALKAQLNPHFIFNALNSIQEYIILNKKDLAGDYLGMFADLMRKYLKHSDAGALTIQDEVDSLTMYLDLESLRFEDTLTYQIKVAEDISAENVKIPTMLIQPYVENALKHGLLHKKENRKVSIIFEKENKSTIKCIIEDNGVGRERAAAIKATSKKIHTSFATYANENRLALLNFGKDKKIGVTITDLKNTTGEATGTKVVLTIPMIK